MVAVLNSVGVPEMVPSVVLNNRPPGKDGEMDHDVMVPLTVGVTEVMAVPLVRMNELGS